MWKRFALLIAPLAITFSGVYHLIADGFAYIQLIKLLVGISLIIMAIREIKKKYCSLG